MHDEEGEDRRPPRRRWPSPAKREPLFNLPPVVVALIAVMGLIHIVRAQLLSPEQDFWVIVHTAFVPDFYSGRYAVDAWSFVAPFSYTLLHGDVIHYGVNAVWLAAFGSPLANRLGAGRLVAFFAFTGLAAAGLHYVLHPTDQAPLIGASGAVSGMMGAAARFGFRSEPGPRGAMFAGPPLTLAASLSSRQVLAFLAIWMAINVFTGLATGLPGVNGQIAWEAHVGGFLAGFLLLHLFLPRESAPA
jgi:membrane associated rhomboid family serine protease